MKKLQTIMVGFILLLVAGCADNEIPGKGMESNLEGEEEWDIIQHGDCYSYRSGTWISDDCFGTYDDAKIDMDGFLKSRDERAAREALEWVIVKGN